jgi:hypothetical protein
VRMITSHCAYVCLCVCFSYSLPGIGSERNNVDNWHVHQDNFTAVLQTLKSNVKTGLYNCYGWYHMISLKLMCRKGGKTR